MGYLKKIVLLFIFLLSLNFSSKGQSFSFFSQGNYDCLTNSTFITYTITILAPPVTPPFTINMFNINTNSASTQTFSSLTGTISNLPIANYNFTIQSTNGAQLISSLQTSNPFNAASVIVSATNVSCFGGSNGIAAAFASNVFTPPLSYTWSNGGNSQQTSNLPVGTHTVFVSDTKSCTVTKTLQITAPSQIFSSLTNSLIPCFGGTLVSAITTSGGISPYTYSVNSTSLPGPNTNPLILGNYTLFTKDANGCVVNHPILLSQVTPPVLTFSYTKPTCPGKADGSATVVVTNAPPPFTYTWNPGSSALTTVNNIPNGNYTLTVKDGSACITRSLVTVLPQNAMTLTPLTKSENCSAVDGAATLTINGGNGPYSYTTIPGNFTSSTFSNVSSGGYTVYIADAFNCRDTVPFFINNLSAVAVSISNFTPVLCYNQCDGKILLNVQNAINPVTFSISGSPPSNSNLLSNVCSGFKIIKVIDAIGCPATTTINMGNPPIFTYSATSPTPICIGKNITLQATAAGGNSSNYNYVWNPGNLTGQQVNISPNVTTVYSLNVFDSNGCTLAPFTVTAYVNAPLQINISNANSGICPGTTAQITPTVTGGDGNYNYNWLPGNINSETIFVESITVPIYTLTVNDACGSPTAIKTITVKLHPVIIPIYKASDTIGCQPLCLKFTNLTPKSTNPIWNFGDRPFETSGNIVNYCYINSGTYNLKLLVTDSNNCKTSFTYTNSIKVLPKPNSGFITNPEVITFNTAENIEIKNTTENGDTYKWYYFDSLFSNQTNTKFTFSDTGCYKFKLLATNNFGCKDTLEKDICVIEGFNFYVPDYFSPNNDRLNDVFMPKGTGYQKDGYLFEVYSRWGMRLFKTNDITEGWRANGSEESSTKIDVYFWRIIVFDLLGNKHVLNGYVNLLH